MQPKNIKTMFFFAIALVLVSGCATPPNEIAASDVSPFQYNHYTCDQISQDLSRKTRKVSALYTDLKSVADTDETQMAVGLILFWPTLFFLEGGDDARASEFAQLKGEIEALHQVAVEKSCSNVPEFPVFSDNVSPTS